LLFFAKTVHKIVFSIIFVYYHFFKILNIAATFVDKNDKNVEIIFDIDHGTEIVKHFFEKQ